jgi:hypothetical protein
VSSAPPQPASASTSPPAVSKAGSPAAPRSSTPRAKTAASSQLAVLGHSASLSGRLCSTNPWKSSVRPSSPKPRARSSRDSERQPPRHRATTADLYPRRNRLSDLRICGEQSWIYRITFPFPGATSWDTTASRKPPSGRCLAHLLFACRHRPVRLGGSHLPDDLGHRAPGRSRPRARADCGLSISDGSGDPSTQLLSQHRCRCGDDAEAVFCWLGRSPLNSSGTVADRGHARARLPVHEPVTVELTVRCCWCWERA